jgi:hypothetical protein
MPNMKCPACSMPWHFGETCEEASGLEPDLLIQYQCPNCKTPWEEVYTSACDSECPSCGLECIEALSWELAD